MLRTEISQPVSLYKLFLYFQNIYTLVFVIVSWLKITAPISVQADHIRGPNPLQDKISQSILN